MPLGAVLPVPFLVLEALVGGQGQACDGHAAGGVLDFRVFAKISDKNDFVDTLCHKGPLLFARSGMKGKYNR